MLTYRGNVNYQDISDPAPGKNEWGIDTLVRKMKGARSLLSVFLATLQQGQSCPGYGAFYLQSWDPDDQTPFATVALYYKGLLRGTPKPIVINDIVPASGSTSADFTLGGSRPAGIVYGQDAAGKDLKAIGASMEFTYNAGQTTYRYISVGQPNGARYHALGFSYSPTLKRARITTSDGANFGILAPLAIGPALAPAVVTNLASFRSNPVFGTPYFECEDVLRTEMGAI